jgi:transcriptional regulator with XRE-family HTH domain
VTVPQPSNPTGTPGRDGASAQREPVADPRARRCRRCRAVLRRTNDGVLCGPCERVTGIAEAVLSGGFFNNPDVVEALTGHDFGRFFRLARADLDVTQEQFGLMIGLAQSQVCKIENGGSRLRNIEAVVRLVSTFRIPPELLGFASNAGTLDEGDGIRAVNWLQRRDFVAAATATALGVGTAGTLHDWLGGFAPAAVEPPGRIGSADVERIEATTAAFRDWDNRWGGGLSRAAVVGQLQWLVATARGAIVASEAVRRRLLVATSDLASLGAWVHYDVERHDEARRLWMIALDAAREAGNVDLVGAVLRQLVHQALHLQRPDEALRLVRLAYAITADPDHRVPERAFAETSAYEAWCHAAAGKVQPCRRAIGRAEEHFANADDEPAPPWLEYFDEVELYALRGHAYHVLGERMPEAAREAAPWLRRAVDGRGPQYARSRTLNLIALSATYFQHGDGLEEGIRIGDEALAGASALNSPRARSRLLGLDRITASHAQEPGVAEFRDRLRLALADAAG